MAAYPAMDEVFKALADPSRRLLLDSLNERNGQTLRELCSGLDMARQSVSKHLAVLEEANLVTTVRRGREKLHYLNAAPINEITDRWINRYEEGRVHALADLKRALEDTTMDKPSFVYTTYIKTTPEQLWKALTEPAFTERYWNITFDTDWKAGSRMTWHQRGVTIADADQVVVESDPYRRLSYALVADLLGDVEREVFECLPGPQRGGARCGPAALCPGPQRDRSACRGKHGAVSAGGAGRSGARWWSRSGEQLQEQVALALVEGRQLGIAALLRQELRQRVLGRRVRREGHELVHLPELRRQRRRRDDVADLPAGDVVGLAEGSDDEAAGAERLVARHALVARAVEDDVLVDLVAQDRDVGALDESARARRCPPRRE